MTVECEHYRLGVVESAGADLGQALVPTACGCGGEPLDDVRQDYAGVV
ncbi:MAG: hypothetical protein WD557_12780 [Dehalococcoidia bacterium]